MIVDLSTPATIDGQTVRSISLRLPGRDMAQSALARIGPDGRLSDDGVALYGARLTGFTSTAIRKLPGRDFTALRYALEAAIATTNRRQSLRVAIAQDQRRRAAEGGDDDE